jgi:CRISPR-associated endonuclease/helicase Cas3
MSNKRFYAQGHKFYAHSSNKAGSPWEPLEEHIGCVTDRVGKYADSFGARQEAIIAGLWHDLGKYSEIFTKRLKGQVSGLDHWSPGAIATLGIFKDKAIAASLAIQGHHIGLQEGSRSGIRGGYQLSKLSNPTTHPLGLMLTEADFQKLVKRFEDCGFRIPSPPSASHYCFDSAPVAGMLDERMLFSALVDADYIETEAHFEGKADGTKIYRVEGPSLQAEHALQMIKSHIEKLRLKKIASDNVRAMRQDLLYDCLEKAASSSNIFTLTAPTGAGKTLAMLAFALKHAMTHPHIRRIILVVPFLSIIEQTANVYRELLEPVFGSCYVLEHHSLANMTKKKSSGIEQDDEEEANRTARLLTENWDAPLVLTTSVQFFESLFANLPGKCRKLHRLANSIIMFDEVQTLPPEIAVLSCAALSHLVQRYRCTVVFSTATQPAFDHLHDQIKQYAATGWQPQAIIEKSKRLFNLARRVRIHWQVEETCSWQYIADRLAEDENIRSLCIVNLKRHAQDLIKLLHERVDKNDLFHLSTNMCPAHRQKAMAEVRKRLNPNTEKPCRLISTQCIEAGVDVDFPVVWRALGPLDAIAQAAGRCNREGRLDNLGGVVVFLPEKEHHKEYLYPPGGYKQATETTQTLLKMKADQARKQGIPFGEALDIYDPDLFNQYYRLLYDLTGSTNLNRDLEDALQRRSFVDVVKYYKVIDQRTINVLVPYAEEIALFNSLHGRLEAAGRLTHQWIQDARPLTVSLYRPKDCAIIWNYLDAVSLGGGAEADDWFIYRNPDDYDPLMGLKPPNEVEAWMV